MAEKDLGPALDSAATDTAITVEPGRTSAIAALRYRDFRLFWFGFVVSNTGTWMQMFGQGYLVVQLAVRDGVPQLAPFYLGIVGLSRAIPGLLFGLFGGVVADRADRRRLLIVTQTLAALTAAALAGLTITERIDIVQILMLGAINSLVFSFDAPTRQSMVPRLVPQRHLMSAVGLNSAAFNGPQILGPVVGGLVVTALSQGPLTLTASIGVLFGLNAVSYAATIAALAFMAPIPVEGRHDQSVLRSIREGLEYTRRDDVTRWLMVMTAASAFLARPYIQLLPAFAHDALGVGAIELSWMLAASGVGSLVGALATASLGGLRRRGIVVLVSVGALGLSILALGALRSLPLTIVVLAVGGATVMLFLGFTNTLLQTRAPDHLRGRVMSVQTMAQIGLIPLGTMALGSLGTVVGVADSFVVGGGLLALIAVYAGVRARSLRAATSAARHRRSAAQSHPARHPPVTSRGGEAAK